MLRIFTRRSQTLQVSRRSPKSSIARLSRIQTTGLHGVVSISCDARHIMSPYIPVRAVSSLSSDINARNCEGIKEAIDHDLFNNMDHINNISQKDIEVVGSDINKLDKTKTKRRSRTAKPSTATISSITNTVSSPDSHIHTAEDGRLESNKHNLGRSAGHMKEGHLNPVESSPHSISSQYSSHLDILQHQRNLLETMKIIPSKVKEIIDRAVQNESFAGDLNAVNAPSGLFLRQVKIEEDQQYEAIISHQESIDTLLKIGQGTGMKQVQKIVLSWFEPLSDAIVAEMKLVLPRTSRSTSSKLSSVGQYLLLLPVDKLAIITIDTVLSCILRTGNIGATVVSLSHKIGQLIEQEVNMMKIKHGEANLKPWEATFIQNASSNKKLVGKLQAKLREILQIPSWSEPIKIRLGAALLTLFFEVATLKDNVTKALVHTLQYKPEVKKKYGMIRLQEELYEEMSKRNENQVWPRFLPMLVEPLEWDSQKKQFGGCYYRLRTEVMRTTSKNHVMALSRANMRPVLDGLNFLAKLKWKINNRMFNIVDELWRRKIAIGEIPSQIDLPKPIEDDYLVLVKRKKESSKLLDSQIDAGNSNSQPESSQSTSIEKSDSGEYEEVLEFDLKRYNQIKRRISLRNAELHSLRCDFKIKMMIAEKFKDDVIYFPWNLDFRGRAYPIPQNLSHLGSDLCRSLLLFSEAKPLGEHGLYWLKVHAANLYGVNKISLEDRCRWVDTNLTKIYDSALNPIDGDKWWTHADEPFQFLATCIEIYNAIESGSPETYNCHLAVHQDGSCNGLQHYAALGRDEIGGTAVNLVPTNENIPQDVYSKVLAIVLEKIEQDCNLPDPNESQPTITLIDSSIYQEESLGTSNLVDSSSKQKLNKKCALFVRGHVSRKVIKQTVMTSVYGVTYTGARAQVQARLKEIFVVDINDKDAQEMEKNIFEASSYVARLTLMSLAEMFESAQAIKSWLATAAKLVSEQGDSMTWITPLGLPVMQPYRQSRGNQVIVTSLQGVTLAEYDDNLPVLKRKQGTAFSPNFVHSLDASHMLMTALKMKEKNLFFTAVHDSYWTHPCDVPVMNQALRECFVELYEKPILESLYESLMIRYPDIELPQLPDRGTLDISKVKQSKYFFH